MAYYDDLKEQAQGLKDAIDAQVAQSESPIVQELQNASEHVEAVLVRLDIVKGLEEPTEEPEE